MAKIGSVLLDENGIIDGGLALLLTERSKKGREFTYRNARIKIAVGSAYVVACFSGANSKDDALTLGYELIHEALDYMSLTGCGDFATSNIEDEYIVWWKSQGKITIAVDTTANLPFSVGSIELIVRDPSGNIIPPTITPVNYDPAFRYYRLSQVSTDLFDAFRNMYLSFELLISTKHPIVKNQREADWIKLVLTNELSTLGLAALCPPSQAAPVDYIFKTIYTDARLPLFHAKDRKAYFLAQKNPQERKQISDALALLTQIVIRIADIWYNTRRIGGGVNLEILDDANLGIFATAIYTVTSNPAIPNETDDLSSAAYSEGLQFSASTMPAVKSVQRFHIYGSTTSNSLSSQQPLRGLHIGNSTSPLIYNCLEDSLDISGTDFFEISTFIRNFNASEPRTLFQR